MISDTDPHRRNLIVVSLGFIVYILAGGHLPDDQSIKFAFVNVVLGKPFVVGLFAVLMLFWFAYRYWLKSPRANDEMRLELHNAIIDDNELKNLAEQMLKEQMSEGASYNQFAALKTDELQSLVNLGRKLRKANITTVASIISDTKDRYKLSGKIYGQMALSPRRASMIAWRLRRKIILESHAFSDWLAPWLLFWLAVSLLTAKLAIEFFDPSLVYGAIKNLLD